LTNQYIVERFDRGKSQLNVRRLHTEDFAQAAGMDVEHKYKMTAKDAITLLRKADFSDSLGYLFIERLAFNTSIANADAHAKNYSVMLRKTGISLAPAYDVLTTAYWDFVDPRLAMHIAGADRPAQITQHHWRKLARSSGLDEDKVEEIAITVASRVMEKRDAAYAMLPPKVRDRLKTILDKANKNIPTNQPNWAANGDVLTSGRFENKLKLSEGIQ